MKPSGVRHLGMKGIVQTGDSIDPAPAIATGQGCEPSVERPLIFFPLDYSVTFSDLKMLNTDSHKRGGKTLYRPSKTHQRSGFFCHRRKSGGSVMAHCQCCMTLERSVYSFTNQSK